MTEIEIYGTSGRGERVHRVAMTNGRGMEVALITYGGALTEIVVPDGAGRFANVLLGCRDLRHYETKSPYFGALVGRFGNRIAGGKFTLDGVDFSIPANNGPNALHGGPDNFSHRVWDLVEADAGVAHLRLLSPDGDQGFPGRLTVDVIYTLGEDDTLRIDYRATVADRPTVINLTNHSYFNLAGDGAGSALDHQVTIAAAGYLPTDAGQIPDGTVAPVAGTAFDFRAPQRVGARIRDDDPQLEAAGGYDHCYVLDRPGLGAVAAGMRDPASGRTLAIETTEPGMQFYAGNKLDGTIAGPAGRLYRQSDGLAFETQHFPDSPNRPEFPSTRLAPGETFASTTLWRFGVSDVPS